MLYIHAERLQDVMPLLRERRPAYVKAIDPDPASAEECYRMGIRVIARHYGPWDTGNGQDTITPQQFVNDCAIQPWYPWVWAVETTNEPHPGNADWMAQVVQLFHILPEPKECVVGNWGNGWSGFYVPGATYYGAHEYGWPNVDAFPVDMAYRYKSWFAEVRRKNPQAMLFITEFGITQAAQYSPGPDIGWHTLPEEMEEGYWQSVLRYCRELTDDPWVLGAFLFNWAVNPQWSTFEHLGLYSERYLTAPKFTKQAPAPTVAPVAKPAAAKPAKKETPKMAMDKKAALGALDVIWGWTNPLVELRADQAVKELRDAVNIIKREIEKADNGGKA